MKKLTKAIFVLTLAIAAAAEAKLAPPKLEDYMHVCKKCGGATHYPKSYTEPRSTVEGLRDGCAKLRSLGLDITLDESVLCRHCVSAATLKIPRFATVVRRPEKSNLRPGDQVEFLYFTDYEWGCEWRVVPKGNRVWVNRKYIDDDGNILGNNVCIRLRPSTEGTWYSHVNKGTKVKILEARQDWVAVEWHNPRPDIAPPSCFGEIEYGEGEDASLSRIVNRLEWIIKGRRSRANLNDMDLLLAYMRGQKEVQVGCIMRPIEKYRPRINELISAPGETDIVVAARRQIGVTVGYDPAYRKIGYPGGDVPRESGVCTDVIIRALRDARKIDLQKLVHEDMKANFAKYPQQWGLKRTDPNIDHRRVPNLQCFFKRKGWSLKATKKASDYEPGDFVTVIVGGRLPHIMIVSDKKAADGTPLVIHNIGSGTKEENCLFTYPLTGHYRMKAVARQTVLEFQ